MWPYLIYDLDKCHYSKNSDDIMMDWGKTLEPMTGDLMGRSEGIQRHKRKKSKQDSKLSCHCPWSLLDLQIIISKKIFGVWPFWWLDFEFLASTAMREQISVVLSHWATVFLKNIFSSTRKLIEGTSQSELWFGSSIFQRKGQAPNIIPVQEDVGL